MKTNTLSISLKESKKFEDHRKLIEKAARMLEVSRRAYRTWARKKMELESEEFFIDRERTKMQAVVAFNQSERAWKYYKTIINKISHS